ncbi:hypothetical protein FGO68_gene13602 [Halteria grandinella]|uniref:Uncharacterized protein n=1 Tax=Halteria grandinella TaxID=5974 RepID=A0A8J8T7W0_HALGN|nr:hypothetical protein FGO68_gene13602 [Halteria grandinella]
MSLMNLIKNEGLRTNPFCDPQGQVATQSPPSINNMIQQTFNSPFPMQEQPFNSYFPLKKQEKFSKSNKQEASELLKSSTPLKQEVPSIQLPLDLFPNNQKLEFVLPPPKDEEVEIVEAHTLLDRAQEVIQRCQDLIQVFDSSAQRVKAEIGNLQIKAQLVVTNFQSRLENYIKSENHQLTEKDQVRFLCTQNEILKNIKTTLIVFSEKHKIFDDIITSMRQQVRDKRKKAGTFVAGSSTKMESSQYIDVPFQQINITNMVNDEETQYIACNNFLCLSRGVPFGGSQVYRLTYFDQFEYLLTLDFKVSVMTTIEGSSEIVFNDMIYSINEKGLTFKEKVPNIPKVKSIHYSEGRVFYGSDAYSKMYVYDLVQKKLKHYLVRKSHKQGYGIHLINKIPGLADCFLLLEIQRITKLHFNGNEQRQVFEEIFNQPDSKILDFKLLSDHLHLVALTHLHAILTIDHFSGEVIYSLKIEPHSPHSYLSFNLFPEFDLEQKALVFINEDWQQSTAVDIAGNGISVRTTFGFKVVTQLNERTYLGVSERGGLCLVSL